MIWRRVSLCVTIIIIVLVVHGHGRCSTEGAFIYEIGDRRDPFMPLIAGQKRLTVGLESIETIDDVRFEGVIYDPSGSSVAVLNGEIVQEGDKINNVEIVEILEDAISLKIYERDYTIELDQEGGN